MPRPVFIYGFFFCSFYLLFFSLSVFRKTRRLELNQESIRVGEREVVGTFLEDLRDRNSETTKAIAVYDRTHVGLRSRYPAVFFT